MSFPHPLPGRGVEEQSGPEIGLFLEWGQWLRRGPDLSKGLCPVGAILMKTASQGSQVTCKSVPHS